MTTTKTEYQRVSISRVDVGDALYQLPPGDAPVYLGTVASVETTDRDVPGHYRMISCTLD